MTDTPEDDHLRVSDEVAERLANLFTPTPDTPADASAGPARGAAEPTPGAVEPPAAAEPGGDAEAAATPGKGAVGRPGRAERATADAAPGAGENTRTPSADSAATNGTAAPTGRARKKAPAVPPVLRPREADTDAAAKAPAPADPGPARASRRKAKKPSAPPVLWPDEAGADAAGAPAGPGPAGVGRSGGGVPPVLWPDEAEPAPAGGVLDESVADLVDGATEEAVATLAADLPPEEAVDGESATSGQRFPDLRADADLDSALEAVLLVVDAPVETEVLAAAVDQPVGRTRQALRRVQARYTEAGSGIDLRRVGAGWRLFTRDRFAPVVEKLLLDGQRAKLTRAALETLAVIAYRQPVSRARVAAVRGVNVDGVIRTLVVRGLIEESGTDSETGGILYVTTELFLERLGLSSLEDLPPIAPLLPEVEAIDDVS